MSFFSRAREEIAVGDIPVGRRMVALAFGQSNAANYGNKPITARRHVYNLHHGKLYHARDPMLGADGGGGSVWCRLGDRLIDECHYDVVIFLTIGVGGSAIDQWAPGGVFHHRMLQTIQYSQISGFPLTHLLWHQGETDALDATPPDEYRRMFRAMLLSIRQHEVTAPIYVSVATRVGGYVSEELQQAQRALISPDDGILAGPDTDTLDHTYRYDGTHFSGRGLDRVADLWFERLCGCEQES